METYRTFVALPLSTTLKRELEGVQLRLQRACPPQSVRWVQPAGMHVTLFFLGDVEVRRLPEIQAALTAVARSGRAITCRVGGLGAFPNLRRPRVVWVGLEEPEGRLVALAQAVSAALEALGFTPEEREFKPHLTLGRVAKQATPAELEALGKALADTTTPVWREVMTEMVFYRSELKPAGAVYTPLAQWTLA